MKEQGFTDIIANLAWADRAFYASSVLPVDPSVSKLGDALEQCLAACRKWGIGLVGTDPAEALKILRFAGSVPKSANPQRGDRMA